MTQSRSGGEILVDGLIKHGAKRLFCVPGESYLAVLDALHDRTDKLEVVTCRQEGGAAYMAEAHAKITRSPGIVFVSRGPGASNAMVGIHTAFQDSTPVLLFIGQVSRSDTGREAFQELNYQEVYGGVAKKVIRMDHVSRIPEQLGQAWHASLSGRPGPVVIELPEDMLKDQAEIDDLTPVVINSPAPSGDDMSQLGGLLKRSRDPIIIAGGAAWTPGATKFVLQFSEKFQVPVATAFRRSDSFDNSHPHYIGELGLGPNPKLVEQAQESDLLIAVGPRLGDMTTARYTTLEPPHRANCNPDQKLVHVHVSGDEIGSVFSVDHGIVSTPENFLAAACELTPGNIDRRERLARGHTVYREWLTLDRNPNSAVRMDLVMDHLRDTLINDAVITVGAGNFSVWGQRNFQFGSTHRFLGSTNGSMGYGVPSAIAAKLALPDHTVVSFSGDGCFLMNGQELATAMQYNLAVIFLVVNNGRYGTIRNHQEKHYPGRVSATGLDNPDFAALARAYGAHGELVTATDQFPEAFDRARDAGSAALIELQVDY